MKSKIVLKASIVDISKEKNFFIDEKDGVMRFIKNEFVFDNSDELPESIRYYARLTEYLSFQNRK